MSIMFILHYIIEYLMKKGGMLGIVLLLGAALIGWTLISGIQIGQHGGQMWTGADTPTLGPHHWNT